MIISVFIILGIASALLNAVAFIPYVWSILRHKTKPQRSSWWLWTGLMLISTVAQVAAGATWSALFTIVFLFGDFVVAFLSLQYGYGKFSRLDVVSIVIALFGIWLWIVTGDPLVALIVTIGVDFLGNMLTVGKSWRAPYSENLTAWMLMGFAAALSAVSVGKWDLAQLIFPLYVVALNGCTVAIIAYRRKWRSNHIKAGQLRRKKSKNPRKPRG